MHKELKDKEKCDINGLQLCSELLHIQFITDKNVITHIQVIRFINNNKMQDNFPNVLISMRNFLTIYSYYGQWREKFY